MADSEDTSTLSLSSNAPTQRFTPNGYPILDGMIPAPLLRDCDFVIKYAQCGDPFTKAEMLYRAMVEAANRLRFADGRRGLRMVRDRDGHVRCVESDGIAPRRRKRAAKPRVR